MKLCLAKLGFGVGLLVGCGPSADAPERAQPASSETARTSGSGAEGGASVDAVEIVGGVPDRSRDPAVVALVIGEDALCTGSLVSPRLVLTARHCVSNTVDEVACPSNEPQIRGDRDPTEIGVLVGDDISTARRVAHGVGILTPSSTVLCDSDIAFVVIDPPVTRIKMLPIRTKGAAKGDFMRAVGFGKANSSSNQAGIKLVREHVRVLGVQPSEFLVGEATCQGDSGGPALDEETGEIAGVVSRGGPSCDGPGVHNIYTRVDAFSALIDEAFVRAAALDHPAGTTPLPRGTAKKPPTDIGGACSTASDCAAGICVTDAARQYCSRSCGSGDRCPATFNCKELAGKSVCMNVR